MRKFGFHCGGMVSTDVSNNGKGTVVAVGGMDPNRDEPMLSRGVSARKSWRFEVREETTLHSTGETKRACAATSSCRLSSSSCVELTLPLFDGCCTVARCCRRN